MPELWELQQKQQLPLDLKILLTKQRITEWYDHHEGQVYVSFSGGKDSTVLLDIVRSMYPEVPAVFVDTGLEYPEIREHVRNTDNVTWLKPKMSFRKVIETYGYPVISKRYAGYIASAKRNPNCVRAQYLKGEIDSKYASTGKWWKLVEAPFLVSDYCCEVMKKQPMHAYGKSTGRVPITGIMASESQSREQDWLKSGCNAFNGKHPISRPMSFWNEDDVLEYILTYNVPIASVYGEIVRDEDGRLHTTGVERTGCIFCMFGCHLEKHPNRFQRLKLTHPKIYDYCMRDWEDGGLGIAKVLDYIHVPY